MLLKQWGKNELAEKRKSKLRILIEQARRRPRLRLLAPPLVCRGRSSCCIGLRRFMLVRSVAFDVDSL